MLSPEELAWLLRREQAPFAVLQVISSLLKQVRCCVLVLCASAGSMRWGGGVEGMVNSRRVCLLLPSSFLPSAMIVQLPGDGCLYGWVAVCQVGWATAEDRGMETKQGRAAPPFLQLQLPLSTIHGCCCRFSS